MKAARTGLESAGSVETGQTVENGKRRSVLAALKEKQEDLKGRGNMADNSKEYKKRGQEL